MADLTGVDLLALIGTDTALRRVASTDGGEHAGPCPFCGGVDRFRAWPDHPSGRGRWWCRQCGRGGDAVDYLRERDGLGFAEAVEALGMTSYPERRRGRRGQERASKPTDPVAAAPAGASLPAWAPEAAMEVVAVCEAALWAPQGERALAWLAKRGIREDTARTWRLGYSPTDRTIAGLFVPRGVVIPCFVDGALWAVKVRRPVPPAPGPKYQQVKGGRTALYGLDHLAGRRAVIVCEGELDAVLLWQEAGDLADVVAVGSATGRPPLRFLARLAGAASWLVAFDRDEAGEQGAGWWGDYSDRVRRIRPLQGRDLTDFHQAGGDLRAWVAYHLGRLEEEPRPAGQPATEPESRRRPPHEAEAEAERLLALPRWGVAEARAWAELAGRAGWRCWGTTWQRWAAQIALEGCVA